MESRIDRSATSVCHLEKSSEQVMAYTIILPTAACSIQLTTQSLLIYY